MERKRICIVTAGSLSSGPRVEKEASALQQAGHDVCVVAYHTLPWMEPLARPDPRSRPVPAKASEERSLFVSCSSWLPSFLPSEAATSDKRVHACTSFYRSVTNATGDSFSDRDSL